MEALLTVRAEPATAGPPAPGTRFSALDSWRGIAALLVALFHLDALGHFYGIAFLRNSHLFVDFFFVLSGFVISYSSYARLTDSRALLPFMIKRFGRVWPLHAVMLAAFVAFPLAEWTACDMTKICGTSWPLNPQRDNLGTYVSNLFLVQALGIYDNMSWNWPSWSVSTEFWTYLFFAVTAITFRALLVPLGMVIVAASALVIFLFAPSYTAFSYSYLRCVVGFFSGFLIFRLYVSGRLPLWRFGTALEALSVVLMIAFVSLVGTSNGAFAAPLVFGLCVYVFAHESGWISRLLTTAPFLKLGEWSYSIYMIHAFILIVILRLVSAIEKVVGQPIRIDIGHPPKLYYYHDKYLMDAMALLYVVTVIAVARFAYHRLEAPARDYFNGLAQSFSGSTDIRARKASTEEAVTSLRNASLDAVEGRRGGHRES